MLNKRGAGQVRPEEGVLRLRKELNAFANLRPCQFASTSLCTLSPLKESVITGTDFVIVRENCGGAYFGRKVEEPDFAADPWQYSRAEIERVAAVAAHLAIDMHATRGTPLRVVSCDKANVLASSRLWRRVVSEVFARDFPQVRIEHQLADSAAMLMMKDPRSFNGVVLMDNTCVPLSFCAAQECCYVAQEGCIIGAEDRNRRFGDILSDVSSVIPGSLGLLPSASISSIVPDSQSVGLYEPIHGSAPDIAGQGTYISPLTNDNSNNNNTNLKGAANCVLFVVIVVCCCCCCPQHMKLIVHPQRNRQPRRHHPVRGNDAAVLIRAGQGGARHREGRREGA